MHPTGETISPRSKFPDQTASINISMPTSLGCLIGVHTRMESHPQGFFLKSPFRLTTRLRKCSLARSTRLLIYWRLRYGVLTQLRMHSAVTLAGNMRHLIPRFDHGLRSPLAKTAMKEPNRMMSPSFNSTSVTKSPLICVPFVEFKSFSE